MTLADRIVIMSSTKNPDGSGTIGRIEQVVHLRNCNEPASINLLLDLSESPAMNSLMLRLIAIAIH